MEYEKARAIVREVGYLPLAIDQAGAYLYALQKPLESYLPLFKQSIKSVLNKRPPDAVWQYRNETVFTTWEVSFSALKQRDPTAAEFLLICSFLSSDDISEDLFTRASAAIGGKLEPITSRKLSLLTVL